jgi:lipopolysaccharide export system permease protein
VRILDRYILAIFLKNMATSLFFMSCLFLFQAMFTDLYNHTSPFYQILIYYLYDIPLIMVQMAAPSALMATALTGASLSSRKELVACFSLGMSLMQVTRNLLLMVLLLCTVVLFAQDQILPSFYRKRSDYYWQEIRKQSTSFLDLKTEKIWYRSHQLIYHLKFFDAASQTILGLGIYQFDPSFRLVESIEAQKAIFDGNQWRLYEGTTVVYPAGLSFPVIQPFTEKNFPISETPQEIQETEKEVDGLNFYQIQGYIQKMKKAGINARKVEVKYYSRLSLSLIPFIMALIAIPFSFSVARKVSVGFNVGICLGMTFLYWFIYSISLSLGSKGFLDPVTAAFSPSAVFGLLALIFLFQKRFF